MTAPPSATAGAPATLTLRHDPDGTLVVEVEGAWSVPHHLPSHDVAAGKFADHRPPATTPRRSVHGTRRCWPSAEGPKGGALALSELLGRLSAEVAGALRNLPGGP